MAATIKLAAANLIQWEDSRLLLDSSKYFTLASLGITVKKTNFVRKPTQDPMIQPRPAPALQLLYTLFTAGHSLANITLALALDQVP
jgi:hypothetical protein